MDKWLKDVGKRITECRKAAGIKAKDVAEKADITPTYLSRIEHGKIEGVSLIVIRNISDAIGCPVKDIIGENEITLEQALEVVNRMAIKKK